MELSLQLIKKISKELHDEIKRVNKTNCFDDLDDFNKGNAVGIGQFEQALKKELQKGGIE